MNLPSSNGKSPIHRLFTGKKLTRSELDYLKSNAAAYVYEILEKACKNDIEVGLVQCHISTMAMVHSVATRELQTLVPAKPCVEVFDHVNNAHVYLQNVFTADGLSAARLHAAMNELTLASELKPAS